MDEGHLLRRWTCPVSRCRFAIFAIAALALGSCAAVQLRPGTQTPRRAQYRLVFSDEFERSGLPDPAKWNYAVHANASGWHNHELQYYSARRLQNARVENGLFIIEARHERLDRRTFPDWGGQIFTSARLNTRGRASWLHGYVEVRARVSCVRGTWPAIWMLPAKESAPWPQAGEIDIMEHVGAQPGVVRQTVQDSAHSFVRGTQSSAATSVPDACTRFHTYRLWWEPGQIRFGIDDAKTLTVTPTPGRERGSWPFDEQPFVLVMNLAVGGDWGGSAGVDQPAFPARMEVDYVRVYQAE